MFNIIDKQTAFKIDFIVRSGSKHGKVEFDRRQYLRLEDLFVWVVSLEDLILAKLKWIQDYQSDRQMNDIKSLMLNPNIDWTYVENWVKKLHLNTFHLFDHD